MNAPFRPQLLATEPVAARGAAAPAWPLWPWWCIAALALIEAAWLIATPLSLAGTTLATIAKLGGLVAAGLLLARRFAGNERLYSLCVGGAFLFAAWPVLRLLNHLTMTLPVPLADARLAGWDRAIGFDWLGYVRFADAHPSLLAAMDLSYGSLTGYSCLLFLLLALGREPARRCAELIVLFLVTALFCTIAGAAFPAAAAMAHYAPPAELFRTIGPATGSYHLESLAALRGNPAHVLDLASMPGLVTFPSFHTAMGVVAIYCARGARWLLAPMLVINGLMIAATPVFGSHYGIDVVAGAAVALGAILVHRRLARLSSNNTCRIRPGSESSPSGAALPI
jgi:PAP2 superfamily protein